MKRRCYKIRQVLINQIFYSRVLIDSHYEVKHSKSITDALILEMVFELERQRHVEVDLKDNYKYFLTRIRIREKQYRLIWLIEKDNDYIGIINAFRDGAGE